MTNSPQKITLKAQLTEKVLFIWRTVNNFIKNLKQPISINGSLNLRVSSSAKIPFNHVRSKDIALLEQRIARLPLEPKF